MVEVADDQLVETGAVEEMQQGNRIASAGDADEVFLAWREVLEIRRDGIGGFLNREWCERSRMSSCC